MSKELDPEGLAAARSYCQWHFGDGAWARLIINAYMNPEQTRRELEQEMDS